MMRTRTILATLVLALGLLGAAPTGQAADKVDPARIAQLIEQMGSAEFEEREKSTVELSRIGLPALPALREALKSNDPEVRRRAADLVGKMEREIQSKAATAPNDNQKPLPSAASGLSSSTITAANSKL